jgi:predicted nucleic acid-binding protein
MTVLLDPSFLVAAADAADLNHRAAAAWLAGAREPLYVATTALVEVDTLLQRELGLTATLAVLEAVAAGSLTPVGPTAEDLRRAADLLRRATEHRPRLADALLVALAERLAITRVATFDRRPLAIFRPYQRRALEFVP